MGVYFVEYNSNSQCIIVNASCAIYGVACYHLTNFPLGGCENFVRHIFVIKFEIWFVSHYVRWGHRVICVVSLTSSSSVTYFWSFQSWPCHEIYKDWLHVLLTNADVALFLYLCFTSIANVMMLFTIVLHVINGAVINDAVFFLYFTWISKQKIKLKLLIDN